MIPNINTHAAHQFAITENNAISIVIEPGNSGYPHGRTIAIAAIGLWSIAPEPPAKSSTVSGIRILSAPTLHTADQTLHGPVICGIGLSIQKGVTNSNGHHAVISVGMQREAAYNIDRGIGKIKEHYSLLGQKVPIATQKEEFVPITNAPRRKPGMGCITEINDHLYEGRWSPKWIDGKRISRNVYATTREECEAKLAQLIRESKIELAELKRAQKKASKSIAK